MSAEVTSPHAIDDETLAAFAEGTLNDDAAATVRAHLADCAVCRDAVNVIAEAEQEEIIAIAPREATVIRTNRFRYVVPVVAAAAAVGAIVFLSPVRQELDDYRTGGMSELERASAHLRTREHETRLSGDFPHKRYDGPDRGDGTAGDGDGDADGDRERWPLKAAIAKVELNGTTGAPSVRELHAAAMAQLLDKRHDEAIQTMQKAIARTTKPDASMLNDLAAMYLERGRFRGDEDGRDAAAALQYAQRAWQVERTPKVAWNLALAYEDLAGRAEGATPPDAAAARKWTAAATQTWEIYLQLDPSSPWADEARTRLADPDRRR